MEPGHEDREYAHPLQPALREQAASMEPGHEDREYWGMMTSYHDADIEPQWSPVMKTGNTRSPS